MEKKTEHASTMSGPAIDGPTTVLHQNLKFILPEALVYLVF